MVYPVILFGILSLLAVPLSPFLAYAVMQPLGDTPVADFWSLWLLLSVVGMLFFVVQYYFVGLVLALALPDGLQKHRLFEPYWMTPAPR